MRRSTCFGRLHAHHQELTTALTASGFTLERGGSSVVGRGLVCCDRPHHDQDNIKMDLQEMGCGVMDWIDLAQDWDRWQALVNAVMNIRVS
jgi:hypothetical protein